MAAQAFATRELRGPCLPQPRPAGYVRDILTGATPRIYSETRSSRSDHFLSLGGLCRVSSPELRLGPTNQDRRRRSLRHPVIGAGPDAGAAVVEEGQQGSVAGFTADAVAEALITAPGTERRRPPPASAGSMTSRGHGRFSRSQATALPWRAGPRKRRRPVEDRPFVRPPPLRGRGLPRAAQTAVLPARSQLLYASSPTHSTNLAAPRRALPCSGDRPSAPCERAEILAAGNSTPAMAGPGPSPSYAGRRIRLRSLSSGTVSRPQPMQKSAAAASPGQIGPCMTLRATRSAMPSATPRVVRSSRPPQRWE